VDGIWTTLKLTQATTSQLALQSKAIKVTTCPNKTSSANGYVYDNRLNGLSLGDKRVIDPTELFLTADGSGPLNIAISISNIDTVRHAGTSAIFSLLDGHCEMIKSADITARFSDAVGNTNKNPALALPVTTPAAFNTNAVDAGRAVMSVINPTAPVAWRVTNDLAGNSPATAVTGLPSGKAFTADLDFTAATAGNVYYVWNGDAGPPKAVTIVDTLLTVTTTVPAALSPVSLTFTKNAVAVTSGVTWSCTPAAKTLPNGSTPYAVTVAAAGTFTITATETSSGLSASASFTTVAPVTKVVDFNEFASDVPNGTQTWAYTTPQWPSLVITATAQNIRTYSGGVTGYLLYLDHISMKDAVLTFGSPTYMESINLKSGSAITLTIIRAFSDGTTADSQTVSLTTSWQKITFADWLAHPVASYTIKKGASDPAIKVDDIALFVP